VTLYTINVPNPAVGKEWKATVPGQWLYHITGITATLNTRTPVASSADSSGNGLNLVVTDPSNHLTWGAPGPYAGGASDYALAATAPGTGTSAQLHTGNSALLGTNPQSIVALCNLATGTDISDSAIALRQLGGNLDSAVEFQPNSADPANLRGVFGGFFFTLANAFLPRGAWHLVGATVDTVNWNVYLDGVLKNTVAGHQPSAADAPFFFVASGFGEFRGSIAAVAVFPVALTAAQQLAYVAAMGSNAAFKAALLADAPAGLWMLDNAPNQTTRTVSLQVTDGNVTTMLIPAPFAVANAAGAILYSWQPDLSSSAQTATGTTVTVATPPLILPAGYTIGTRTADLVATDQWSNITIWWDSDVMDSQAGGVNPYAYPPGAHLIYEQRTNP
jgi:hypothetical protein